MKRNGHGFSHGRTLHCVHSKLKLWGDVKLLTCTYCVLQPWSDYREISVMCQISVSAFSSHLVTPMHFIYLFILWNRNAVLEGEVNKVGCSLPAARKTGTTICGVVFKVSDRNALCVCVRACVLNKFIRPPPDVRVMPQLPYINNIGNYQNIFLCFCNG